MPRQTQKCGYRKNDGRGEDAKVNLLKNAIETAETEQRKAQQAQRISEAGRLAFLTQQELEKDKDKNNVENAIRLAYRAYQLSDEKPSLPVTQALVTLLIIFL